MILMLMLGLGWSVATGGLWAQAEEVTRERAEYRAWLEDAPNSPLAALAQRRIASRVVLGPPESDIPLPGLEPHTLEEGRLVRLTGPAGRRPLPRNRLLPLGPYRIFLSGARGRTVVTVYDSAPRPKSLSFYPYDPKLIFTAKLVPPKKSGAVRVLTVDGVEVEATEAGTFRVPLGPEGVDLRVRRIPDAGTEESELEIYFRDETNDEGTYPAGRFVSLRPMRDGRYVLDFNRARSPFCAYSSVYPCPIPWSGNAIPAAVTAGERYEGGGLEVPKPGRP
ncbi:MAG: DUF1684 domain-containing protein [Gemmatimonadales bacterium]|nr:DUF1684 domain-containing protein [Gemmatimonadales bacterium]